MTTATATRPLSVSPVSATVARVVDAHGRIIGHLQRVLAPEGVRFRARRYNVARRAFVDVGDFWSEDDAIECLRLTR